MNVAVVAFMVGKTKTKTVAGFIQTAV